MPGSASLPALDRTALASLVPSAVELDSLSASEITELSRRFAADADMLQERLKIPIRDWRACWASASRRPSRTPRTCSGWPAWPRSRTGLSGLGYRLPGLEAAGHAARVLQDAWQAVARAEADASAYYTPAVLREDVEGLASPFRQ